MRITKLIPAAALACGAIAFNSHASEVLSAEVQSPALGRALTYNVYLPTGYAQNTNVRYPVMYLLHGNGGVRNDWAVKGKMQKTVDTLVATARSPRPST